MSRIIKRYSNRKLYDVQERRYITLNEINKLIKKNEEIQVIDKVTGKDITEQTFSKLIFTSAQQSKKNLPKSVLVDLLQGPSDVIMGYVKKTFSAGMETVQQLDSLAKLFQNVINPNKKSTSKIDKELGPSLKVILEGVIKEFLPKYLATLNIPKQDEIQQLYERIDELEKQIETLAFSKKNQQPTKIKSNTSSTSQKRKKS